MIAIGTDVLVSAPKHESSAHSNSFQGIISSYNGKFYRVTDADGDNYDVEEDEIQVVTDA